MRTRRARRSARSRRRSCSVASSAHFGPSGRLLWRASFEERRKKKTTPEILGDAEGEGRACAALAAAWRASGDDGRAREYLELCLSHAVATEDLAALAAACRTLGALHSARGDFARAVELLERNFAIARQLLAAGDADTALVERARVCLGIALANAALKRYVRSLKTDFPALLAWKNGRAPLPSIELAKDQGTAD